MSFVSWWWNNVGLGGAKKGAAAGDKAGGKVGHDINKALGLPDTPTPGEISSAVGGVSGAANDLKNTADVAKAIWFDVTDYRFWRSLGWLMLGILMLILGFVIWNRKSIEGVAGSAAKLAVL